MAKTKLKLVNESRQRRDVILLKKEGGTPCSVLAGTSVSISKSEISPQLQSMLDNPSAFGLRLEEEVTAPPRTPKNSDDENEEGE